jgi:uncharacterized protein (TIGR02453 family)
MPSPHFTPALFRFLEDLKRHNHRAWFQANRERYEEQVRQPFLRFIADLAPLLHKTSPYYEADPRPAGGSMFRIHRDTRFSKDKSPYKTHVAAHFQHRASRDDVQVPGFYLRLAPDRSMGAAGLWRPEPEVLKKVRDAIVKQPRRWRQVKTRGLVIEGQTLKRPPKGYDPDHPLVEDLKRKDFVTAAAFTRAEVCSPGFLKRYAEACRRMAPLVAFLTRGLGLPW